VLILGPFCVILDGRKTLRFIPQSWIKMVEKGNTKINDYREKAGLTLEELGAILDVARQTVASWESGKTSPSLAEAAKLARALKIPIELLLEEEADQEAGLLFRADDPSTLTPELRAYLSKKSAQYRELESILEETPAVPFSRPLEDVDAAVIKETADEVRNWLGVGDAAPVSEMYTLLESRGLKVLEHQLPEDISGFSAYTDDSGAVIVVNNCKQPERRYFTCIHELAHLIFHRKEYLPGAAAAVKKRKDAKEKAADKLAGMVMLPDKVVYSELHTFKNRWIPEPVLRDIKQRYCVSMLTIVLRAGDVGLLTSKECGVQFGYLNKHNTDLKDANRLPEPAGLRRLKRLTYQALLDGHITTGFAKDLLDCKLAEIASELKEWRIAG
jgi:Zn-dependent peptidase ImmA (M78 family)/DNA-binding XRE family transcriptional regulator